MCCILFRSVNAGSRFFPTLAARWILISDFRHCFSPASSVQESGSQHVLFYAKFGLSLKPRRTPEARGSTDKAGRRWGVFPPPAAASWALETRQVQEYCTADKGMPAKQSCWRDALRRCRRCRCRCKSRLREVLSTVLQSSVARPRVGDAGQVSFDQCCDPWVHSKEEGDCWRWGHHRHVISDAETFPSAYSKLGVKKFDFSIRSVGAIVLVDPKVPMSWFTSIVGGVWIGLRSSPSILFAESRFPASKGSYLTQATARFQMPCPARDQELAHSIDMFCECLRYA